MTTTVEVRVFFGLTDCLEGAGRIDVEPREHPVTAGSVAREAGLPADSVGLVMVNGCVATLETPVAPGDRVAYFPDYVPYHKVYGMCIV